MSSAEASGAKNEQFYIIWMNEAYDGGSTSGFRDIEKVQESTQKNRSIRELTRHYISACIL